MGKFNCHKIVKASQIVAIESNILKCADGNGYKMPPQNTVVGGGYQPKTDDYVVQYQDGCYSVSPRDAFEAGYHPTTSADVVGVAPLGSHRDMLADDWEEL